MAIAAEISAMLRRDRLEPAIATIKKTIVPHSSEPPYLTMKGGDPRPSPYPRKARPKMIIDRQRQARTSNAASNVLHARPCAEHPRLCCIQGRTTWMSGTKPG